MAWDIPADPRPHTALVGLSLFLTTSEVKNMLTCFEAVPCFFVCLFLMCRLIFESSVRL